MSDRERIYQLLDEVPDNKIAYIIGYIQGIMTEGDIPNQETIEAMQEVEDMKKNPDKYKAYNDVDVMLEELLA